MSFFLNKKWIIWSWGGLIILLISIYTQVHISVLINSWYGEFYDILQKAEQHNIQEFWSKILDFFSYAIPYMIIATATNWYTRVYAFKWREAITFDYIPKWREVTHDIEGSSQRIQEDIYRFAKIIESLELQVVRAFMTLIAFIPILWTLSAHVDISYLKDIEGSLVWGALLVSLGGLFISWLVGWYLPNLEYNNQKVEAAFRKELVLGEDDKINYAAEETLFSLFVGLKINYQRLFNHFAYFDLWLNLYSQVMIIVPYLIIAPSLFTGAVTLGIVVQVSNAFQKVYQSFSLFIENWVTITELRSIWRRLTEFQKNINKR